MPMYAYVLATLKCPTCGADVDNRMGTGGVDYVGFQWGFATGRYPSNAAAYKTGEPIRWKKCPDGTTPAWTYFHRISSERVNDAEKDLGLPVMDSTLESANLGDPAIQNLIIRDNSAAGHTYEYKEETCVQCIQRFDGAVVEIRNGVITRTWLAVPGEFTDTTELNGVVLEVDCYLIQEDGTLTPVPEWTDQRMQSMDENCRPIAHRYQTF